MQPIILAPLLGDRDAAAMVDLWHEFGSTAGFGQYSNESAPAEFAPELAQQIGRAHV